MSYRKILVPVFGSVNDRPALQCCLRSWPQQFGAHVEALFVRLDPVRAMPYGYIGIDVSGYSAQYAIEAAIKAAEEAQKIATESFAKAVEKSGIEINEKPGARTDATTQLKVVQGDFADEIERASAAVRSRRVRRDERRGGDNESMREGFEAALLSGARPVLFVPREPAEKSRVSASRSPMTAARRRRMP